MKAKKIRRQMRKALEWNIRGAWAQLVALRFRERMRLAWLMLRGSNDLDWAAGTGGEMRVSVPQKPDDSHDGMCGTR